MIPKKRFIKINPYIPYKFDEEEKAKEELMLSFFQKKALSAYKSQYGVDVALEAELAEIMEEKNIDLVI